MKLNYIKMLPAAALLLVGSVAMATSVNPDNQHKENKVALCHLTDSNNNPWVVQEVNANEVQSHLAKGDYLYEGPSDTHGEAARLWCARPHISKQVEDVTTGSGYIDADTAGAALNVHAGDTLTYKVTTSGYVKGLNKKDVLPSGVTLVSTSGALAGTAPVYITVKVTASDPAVVKNTACLVRPIVKEVVTEEVALPCDDAFVKVVTIPTPTPSPSISPSPSASPSPSPIATPQAAPLTLPSTGGSGRSHR